MDSKSEPCRARRRTYEGSRAMNVSNIEFFMTLLATLTLAQIGRAQTPTPITSPITSGQNCGGRTGPGCVVMILPVNASAASVTVNQSGWSGTLVAEESANGGVNWSSAGAPGQSGLTNFSLSGAAYTTFRLRATSFNAGTATVTINYSTEAGGGGGGRTLRPSSKIQRWPLQPALVQIRCLKGLKSIGCTNRS